MKEKIKMKKFLQIHMLTSYPPSNLNRDDLGRPKTAIIGGTTRLRVSSQSLKRAWRTSSVFQERTGNSGGTIDLHTQTGVRTKRIGEEIYKKLTDGGIKETEAVKWTRSIVEQFGKLKKETDEHPDNLHIEQLAFISPEEQKAIFGLVDSIIKSKKEPVKEELALLRHENTAADLALFGRMLASSPSFNVDAACQVSHAFSVQKVVVEDDFFTAVDDLNKGIEDAGAGHMGDVEFASGIFYTYIAVDRELLLDNLKGAGKESNELLDRTIKALIEAAATIAPTGKQNTFASRARAHYIMAEIGNQQPRSLALAYVKAVSGDMLDNSIKSIHEIKEKMDTAYGKCSDESEVMDVLNGEGSLESILNFAVKE
jgi:CRISPR system Cascade subunit CasC